MAARFKKRPPGNDNKLLRLDMLTLYDLMCTVCQSIYIEPVTLPCYHDFCLTCFNGTIENNALQCPLCRTRIGSWLRKTSKRSNLVNIKLWNFIKEKYPEEIKTKLSGGEVNIIKDENIRKICAPGEIRQEYETEIQKLRRERLNFEEKHSKETERLIREMQEQERLEREERLSKLQQDELLARQLAESSQKLPESSLKSPSSGKGSLGVTPGGSASKGFYEHLASGGRPNGCKPNTLDRYLMKKNGNSVNGYVKNGSTKRPAQSSPSPELISTAGRCGRFLKNFLTSKLWGSSFTDSTSHTKNEPKVWEPQGVCWGHERQLSVLAGQVEQQESRGPGPSSRHPPLSREERDIGSLEPDTASEDSLAQELCYFKPLHPAPVNRYSGKCHRCIPVRPSASYTTPPTDDRVVDVNQQMASLEKLKGPHFWKERPRSSFICLLSIPASYAKTCDSSQVSETSRVTKNNQKTNNKRKSSPTKGRSSTKSISPRKSAPKKFCNNYSDTTAETNKKSLDPDSSGKEMRSGNKRGSHEITPKDASPRKSMNVKLSRSCVKLGSNTSNPGDQILTRSKRSISFGSDLPSLANDKLNGNKTINGKIHDEDLSNSYTNMRVLRRNGHLVKKKECIQDANNLNHTMTRRKSQLLAEEENIKLNNNHHQHKNGYNTSKEKPSRNQAKKCDRTNGGRNSSDITDANDFVLDNLDPSLLEEQKRIEEMIAQEKKDFVLAQKLQKQLCNRSNYTISTGFTVRTAAKRQATLSEMLPTPKKMKV